MIPFVDREQDEFFMDGPGIRNGVHQAVVDDIPGLSVVLLLLFKHLKDYGSGFSNQDRVAILEQLEQIRTDESFGSGGGAVRVPGAESRWSGGKDLSWEPLRPQRVVEVAYDHMQGDRFRHTTRFRRWRTDRNPGSCTYAQLERPVRFDLAAVLTGS